MFTSSQDILAILPTLLEFIGTFVNGLLSGSVGG
jgi:hypothetical protein